MPCVYITTVPYTIIGIGWTNNRKAKRVSSFDSFCRYVAQREEYGLSLTLVQILQDLHDDALCHGAITMDAILLSNKNQSLNLWKWQHACRIPVNGSTHVPLEPRIMALTDSAPELFAQEPFMGSAIDLWSVMLILWNLVADTPLFAAPTVDDARFYQVCVQGQRLRGPVLSDALWDLILSCLCHDPSRRLTLSQVQQHAWVTGDVTMPVEDSQPGVEVK